MLWKYYDAHILTPSCTESVTLKEAFHHRPSLLLLLELLFPEEEQTYPRDLLCGMHKELRRDDSHH